MLILIGPVPVQDWLCDALTPMAHRKPQRLSLVLGVRDELARAGTLPADATQAKSLIDDEVKNRVGRSGRSNVSRAVTELVHASLLTRHFQGSRGDHQNRGAQRQAVYTISRGWLWSFAAFGASVGEEGIDGSVWTPLDWIDETRPADHEARSSWLARSVPLVAARNRDGLGLADHGAAEFLRGKLGLEQTYGGLGYEVAQAFTASVRRRQAAKGASSRLVAIALAGPADAIATLSRESFADGVRPLAVRKPGLARLPGRTDAERFAATQAIEREIWLLNGGNGNPQGTLPDSAR